MSGDKIDLITKIQQAGQRMVHVPGRGDMEPRDEYRVVVTAKERDIIVSALRLQAATRAHAGAEVSNGGHTP
jgi:hypothetical protein